MNESGLIYLLWSDLVGMTRTRGVPLRDFDSRLESGLGWACAGQAMTPFEHLADNPWGPMEEVRQIPDPATRFTIPASGEHPALHAVICDSRPSPGEDWSACVRSFCRNAIADLKAETGLDLIAAFELEFLLEAPDFIPEAPFSFEAARAQHGFLTALEDMLSAAGVAPETVEPEYGRGQYEIAGSPRPALKAADAALVSREITREAARRHGLRASFSPKPTLDHVGNGSHIHFSLADSQGRNVTSDGAGPLGLGETAARFCAGILAHMDALLAITAPSPVSYHRLGSHHWSAGYRCIGLQNREAAIRIMPGSSRDAEKAAEAFNFEFRASDCTASPYLAVGVLARAGLQGIRENLSLPAPAKIDPAEMSEAAREEAGITPLPASLDAALAALEADDVVRGWFSDELYRSYVSVKSWEADFAKSTGPEHLFTRYRLAY
jgi:glutamine synthetase